MYRLAPAVCLATLLCSACSVTWREQSVVHVRTDDLLGCVSTAVADVPGVSVDSSTSSASRIVLNTPLRVDDSGPQASVVQTGGSASGEAQLQFAQWGPRESDSERERIAPLARAITDSIQNRCGAPAPVARAAQ